MKKCKECNGELIRKPVKNHDKVNAYFWYMYGFKCQGICKKFFLDRDSKVKSNNTKII